MFVILQAIDKWRSCLIGRHFKVKPNHEILKYFLELRLSSEDKQKWFKNMLGYVFKIIYKKWKQNVVANALSRKEYDTKGLVCAIYSMQSDWVEEART